jgi:hypothetical protein
MAVTPGQSAARVWADLQVPSVEPLSTMVMRQVSGIDVRRYWL